MAAHSQSSDDGMLSGINVTPLVDITLVLLIIFMVTAKLIVSQTLPMDLPKAATGSEIQTIFSVKLLKDGATVIDSEPVDNDAQIVSAARDAAGRDASVRAVIHADSAVPHGKVVRVMDLLKQAGIGKIAFGVTTTEPESLAEGK